LIYDLFMAEKEKYNIEQAQEEAAELKRLVKENPGATYNQAERHIETSPGYLYGKKAKEREISEMVASGQAKDRNEAKAILQNKVIAEWRRNESPVTGLYADYYNEIARLALRHVDKQEISKRLKSRPMQKYVDRYGGFDYIVTAKNEKAIHKLDELVDHINSNWTDPEKFTEGDVEKVRDEISKLIYGD
jgi:hypothetical protein